MEALHRLSKILLDRETIDRNQFLKLLDGVPEDEVFPQDTTDEHLPVQPSEGSGVRPRQPGFPLPAPPDAPPAGA